MSAERYLRLACERLTGTPVAEQSPALGDISLAIDAATQRLLAENERLRALLAHADDAIRPTRDGKRDGGTFGALSQVSDEIRAALDATTRHPSPTAQLAATKG